MFVLFLPNNNQVNNLPIFRNCGQAKSIIEAKPKLTIDNPREMYYALRLVTTDLTTNQPKDRHTFPQTEQLNIVDL